MDVIVRQLPQAGRAPASIVEALGGHVGRQLDLVNGFTARIPASGLARLALTPGVVSVTPDAALRLQTDAWSAAGDLGSLANVAKATGAADAWSAGDSGQGVDVALIDSGVARVQGLDGAGKVVDGPDFSFESRDRARRHLDTFGHGTHMAGIIAGHDAAFTGIAPDARLVSVKVASSDGATDVSQVIEAIGWVVRHGHDDGLNIRVVNLSFSTDPTHSYLLDPLAHAVESAWQAGVVVVASAGNDGLSTPSLTSPATDPYVIAVGASDHQGTEATSDDVVASFSNRGNDARHPDLVAPGRSIVSLRNPGSYIDEHHPEGLVAGDATHRFFRGTGTSQATAVVSGAVALLLEQRPELSPDQVKALLTTSAQPLARGDALGQGAGLIDVDAALERADTRRRADLPVVGHRASRWQWCLDRSSVVGSSVVGSSVVGSSVVGSSVVGSSVVGSSVVGSSVVGSSVVGSSVVGSSVVGSSVVGSSVVGSSVVGSSVVGSSVVGSSVVGSSVVGSSVVGSSVVGSSVVGSSVVGSSVVGSSVVGSSVVGSSVVGSSVVGSSVVGSSVVGSSVVNVQLGHLSLSCDGLSDPRQLRPRVGR